jgi:hypothetical protein
MRRNSPCLAVNATARQDDIDGMAMPPHEASMISSQPATRSVFEIRFQSLFHEGRALAFPCDHEGHVDVDALSSLAKDNYLFARAMVGREYATPAVRVREMH